MTVQYDVDIWALVKCGIAQCRI